MSIAFLLAVSLSAAPPSGTANLLPYHPLKAAVVDNTTYINANRILMFVTNHGNFGRDLSGVFGYDFGTWFPYTSIADIIAGKELSPNYAGGLWVGGVDSATGQIRVTVAIYSDEYVPGPMRNGTFEPDQPQYRVFKLFGDSLVANPNQDYLDYLKYAIAQGAPFKVTPAGDTIPDMKGDQMCWSVFNDANPAQHTNDAGSTAPLGIEVKSTIFAFERTGSLGNIVFLKWRIFNKGNNTIRNCFFSVWDDPDLGGSGDDLIGCDTLLSVGYDYNATNTDQYYKDKPPCYGICFFQGPLRLRTPADSLLPDGRMWDTNYTDSVNIGMVSFNKYINGTDPNSAGESYNNMLGLNRDGSAYVYNGDTLKFLVSGDPVEGTGDLDPAGNDKRMNETTGPITFRPGDSTEILAAIVIGQGADRLNSVTVMKELAKYSKRIYLNNFNPPKPPAKPVVTTAQLHDEITLSWTDTSEVDQGDYAFEGYTVWQAPTASGPWSVLATYDLVNDRTGALLDTIPDPASGLNLPVVQRVIKNTGLTHSYTTTTDGLIGGKLNDLTQYYFRVSAFSFDYIFANSRVPNGDRFLESQTTVTVVPQAPVAGLHPSVTTSDTLKATHSTGLSDGSVNALIMDPTILTGHTYRVIFRDTLFIDSIGDTANQVWDLYDVTASKLVLKNQVNQSGNDNYRVIDGMMIKTSGPAVDFKNFEVVANASGVLDPPEGGAFGFAGFPSADPTTRQQVGGSRWGIHTADNGGSCAGGTRGSYAAFFSRCTRDGADFAQIGSYDYEIRFTGSNDNPGVNGGYAALAFTTDSTVWVPFEIWRTGINTPNDPSDDIRLVIEMIDDGADNTFNLESWGCITDPLRSGGDGEHSVSGGDNDPFTDWIYFRLPTDMTPGHAGYDANVAQMLSGVGNYDESLTTGEVMARVVIVSWNGQLNAGDTLSNPPQFIQPIPEQGTVFRIITTKPNTPGDTFTFVASAPTFSQTNADLSQIKAVPNPFYLFSSYDPNPGSNQLKFHHLPSKCTITIYNLAGDLIKTINKDDPTPIASWDLLSGNNLPVASGIYIYVVNADGFGQFVGKVAVFVEAEVLKIF